MKIFYWVRAPGEEAARIGIKCPSCRTLSSPRTESNHELPRGRRRQMKTQWNVLDLFSRVGGIFLDRESAGMRTRAVCEIEPFRRKVLDRHIRTREARKPGLIRSNGRLHRSISTWQLRSGRCRLPKRKARQR